MEPLPPFNQLSLVGLGQMRCATVAWPTDVVRAMLPEGLELGPQEVSPPGTHPVILFFNDMLRAHLTVPSLLPSLSYYEQIVGVPYTYVIHGALNFTRSGPFFFMPQLNLDSMLATLGGLLWWGFVKRMARISVTPEAGGGQRYNVMEPSSGAPLITLDSVPTGDFEPLSRFQHFPPIQEILNQPLVSRPVLGMGPFYACSNFDKRWEDATLRPLSTVVHIHQAFVPGLPCGRFEQPQGIVQDVLGSFELHAAWRLSALYPPEFHTS